jgi:Tfp pilus assembly protein PilV
VAGISLPEILVAALLIGIALVPLLHLYPGTLGFNVETEVDTVLSAAAVRKMEELIGALRATGGGTVTFDAASSAMSSPTNALTWTHTPVGTPSLVVVGVMLADTGATVSTVTYGGTALTLIRSTVNGSLAKTWLYRLASPPAGAQTVIVILSAADRKVAGAITVTGSDTATPISNHAGAIGTSTTPSVTVTSAAGELVVDTATSFEGGTWTAGAGQTEWWDRQQNPVSGAGSTEAGAASVTMSWTNTLNNEWAISAASIKAAGGAAVGSGTAACTDLPNCRLVWTITTELSSATSGVGTLKTVQVVACQDDNGNSACDGGERRVRYDAKITSRP